MAAWLALLAAHARATDRLEAALTDAALPGLAWFDVLATIHRADEQRLRHYELASEMVMSRSGLSRLVDRIEAAGLIERQSCPSDRRGQHLALTAAGREMLERAWPVYEAGVSAFFSAHVGDDVDVVASALRRVEEACRTPAPPCGESAEASGAAVLTGA